MRFATYYPFGVLAAALLASCSSDPAAPTAPTTPSFSQATTINPTHLYRFSLSCSKTAFNSVAIVTFSDGSSLDMRCGEDRTGTAFIVFDYRLFAVDQQSQIRTVCDTTEPVNTTGDFKCKTKNWSATLTVTDLGPV